MAYHLLADLVVLVHFLSVRIDAEGSDYFGGDGRFDQHRDLWVSVCFYKKEKRIDRNRK
jgi:hypothetical protein